MRNKKVNNYQLSIINYQLLLKLFILALIVHCSLITINCFSQQVGVGINSTGAPANASAILDVSSISQGALIPRMTTSQRDAIVSPAHSLLIFNTTTQCYEGYNSNASTWVTFGCFGCSVPSQPSAITGTGTVCQSQSGVAFSVTNVAGDSYTWAYSGTGFTIGSGSGTSSISANFSASATSGTLSVTGSNACGSGTSQTLAITVNSIPSQPSVITGAGTVCQGQSGVAFSVTNVTGVSYTWSYSGTGFTIGSGSGTSSIGANFSATATSGTLSVSGSNACGSGTARTLAITLTSLPVATFSYTSPSYCLYAANPLPTFSGGGVAGTFSSTAGLNFVSTSTGQVNLSTSTAGGPYTVTNTIAASGGCSQVQATSTITIASSPDQPTATVSTQPTCAAQIGAITITAPTGAGMTYSIDNGRTYTNTTGIFSGVISGTYTVTASNGGCISPAKILTTNLIQPCPCTWNGSTSFTDGRDSKVYNQVRIGSQCWMAQNLNYGTYIPYDGTTPLALGQKYCSGYGGAFDNNSSCPIGGLYQWYVAMNQGPPAGVYGCDGTGAGQPACTTPVVGICALRVGTFPPIMNGSYYLKMLAHQLKEFLFFLMFRQSQIIQDIITKVEILCQPVLIGRLTPLQLTSVVSLQSRQVMLQALLTL